MSAKTDFVYSFAFSNLFRDTHVSAILSATRASVDPKESLFYNEQSIHEKLFLGAHEDERTIYGATQHLLTVGARAAIQMGQKAFIVGVREDDPLFSMDIHDARIEALRRIMSAAREAFMAGNLSLMLPQYSGHPSAVMGHLRVHGSGKVINLGTMRFSSWRFAKIKEEMEAFALFVQPSEKAKEAIKDLDDKSNLALAEVSRSVRSMMRPLAREAVDNHVPKADPVAEFSRLWATVCSEATTRVSKLLHVDFDDQEFGGDHVRENGGIAPDTKITYIASSFLDGLVNYGRNHVCMMYAKYGLRDGDPEGLTFFEGVAQECEIAGGSDPVLRVNQIYQEFVDRNGGHLRCHGDNWLIVYETDNSFYMLDYDMDSSDCSIARYAKSTVAELGINTLDEFLFEVLIEHREAASYINNYSGLEEQVIVRRSAANNGWISS